MELKGEQHIPAPRQRVWEALNDPEVLKQCIPGCQTLEKQGDDKFTATVKAKVGPVSASFTGEVTLSDLNPPESYTISGEGKGGAAGFAKGGANVHLAEDGPSATLLTYTVNANVGGKLAQIGSRLIDSTAKKLSGEFFAKFSEVVASGEPAPAAAPAAAIQEPAPPPSPAPKPHPAEDHAHAAPAPAAPAHEAPVHRRGSSEAPPSYDKGIPPMILVALVACGAAIALFFI